MSACIGLCAWHISGKIRDMCTANRHMWQTTKKFHFSAVRVSSACLKIRNTNQSLLLPILRPPPSMHRPFCVEYVIGWVTWRAFGLWIFCISNSVCVYQKNKPLIYYFCTMSDFCWTKDFKSFFVILWDRGYRLSRLYFAVLKMIAGLTVMLQCHLVTEDDNKTFSSDNEVFKWLVAVLDSAVCGKQYRGLEFPVIEVIEVIISVSSQIFFLNSERCS